jgi:hypothetical protein
MVTELFLMLMVGVSAKPELLFFPDLLARVGLRVGCSDVEGAPNDDDVGNRVGNEVGL